MIKRLRKRIVAYSTLSIFALLFLAFIIINIVNFTIVSNDADRVTRMIANENGQFANFNPEYNPANNSNTGFVPEMGPSSPETKASSRYFTASIDDDGNVAIVAFHLTEQSMTQNEAMELAKTLADKDTGWVEQIYRYRVYDKNGTTYVTVVDQGRELRPSFNVLYISIAVLVLGTIVSFLILLKVSKYFVKPVEESDNKQKRFLKDATYAMKVPTTIIEEANEQLKNQEDALLHQKINEQVIKLNKIINNMNTISILKDEKKMFNEEFDARFDVDEVISKYEKSFKDANITFVSEISSDLKINMDKDLFRKVINELLDNGLKYSCNGFNLKIEKLEERLVVSTSNKVNDLLDGDYSRVFERFYRLDNETTTRVSGNGLGLAIVYEIVAKYHGRVSAKVKNNNFIVKVEI